LVAMDLSGGNDLGLTHAQNWAGLVEGCALKFA
jgi:hypothetical protein